MISLEVSNIFRQKSKKAISIGYSTLMAGDENNEKI